MRSTVTALLSAAVVLAMATAVPAFEKELATYYAATFQICDRGVTPEMHAKFDALVAAVDRAQYGYGRSGSPSNFWGPTRPELLFEQCHQSGDGGSGSSD